MWRSDRRSAVKAVFLPQVYAVESECYRRLADAGVRDLGGLAVPGLIGFDDELQVVEMSIVQPPFLLDFGKVYLDRQPPYWEDPTIRAETLQLWRERFGDRWPDVAAVLEMLKTHGIHYVDPRPGNIEFG